MVTENEKFQLSALVSLKKLLAVVLFMGAVSQSWAQLVPPVIDPLIGQPDSRNVIRGANVQFTVLATSLTTPTYQWRLNGTNIANATGSSYTRANVQNADAGKYSVVVRNAAGSTTSSDAILTVDTTPVRLSSTLLNDGSLKLNIAGPLIGTYVVQSSTDLKTWTSISTNTVLLGLLELIDSKASSQTNGARSFYRAYAY